MVDKKTYASSKKSNKIASRISEALFWALRK